MINLNSKIDLLFSPLEQFQTSIIFPMVFKFFDFSVTNFSISAISIALLIIFLFSRGVIIKLKIYNQGLFQFVIISLYAFISSILIQQTGNKGRPYISFACTIFLFVLFSNLFGLTVIGFTLTAQLTVTVGLAVSINLGLCLLGFYIHGLRFLKFFIPSGIPVVLIPFMVIIEVFSYSIRSISLSVRLFANMMAGHTLLHIISSFFMVLFWGYSHYYLASLAFCLLFAISVLEIVIAFLQGYIFLILFCIYLNDALVGGDNHL